MARRVRSLSKSSVLETLKAYPLSDDELVDLAELLDCLDVYTCGEAFIKVIELQEAVNFWIEQAYDDD